MRHRTLTAPTDRELEVLLAYAHGRTVSETAAQLGITRSTVKNHLQSLYRKLEVGNRTEATMAAIRMGFLQPH